jgi:hypothetical protein
VATVTKKPRTNSAAVSLDFAVANGVRLNLDQENLERLDHQQKQQVVQQLQVLQDQMASLMAQLQH